MRTSSIGTVRSPSCITNIRLMSTWWYVVGFRTRSILAPIAVIHAPRILGAPLGAPSGSFFINHFVLAAPSRLVARHRAAQSCKLLHRPRAISPAGAASSVPILQRTQRETHTRRLGHRRTLCLRRSQSRANQRSDSGRSKADTTVALCLFARLSALRNQIAYLHPYCPVGRGEKGQVRI